MSQLKEESGEWHSYAAQEGELTEAAGGGELLVAPCHMTTVLVPEFLIRIHLIRIWIQHFRLNTDPHPDPILCGRCLSEFMDWRYSQSC